MNFPALDLVAMASRIHGGVPAGGLGYSGGGVVDLEPLPGPGIVGVEFNIDGTVDETSDSTNSYSGDPSWVSGTFDPADYEIGATMISGTTTPSGTIPFGSFASLASAKYLKLIRTTSGEDLAVFDIEIREIATPANNTIAQVTLNINLGSV